METSARTGLLGTLLRETRKQIHPETTTLGAFQRLTSRIGKPVTQEEVAEAADITRVWYAMLERGARIDVSTALLGRLADVLMLSKAERSALYAAGVPGLPPVFGVQAGDAIEAFTWVRRAMKQLWSSTSEAEALDVATDMLAARFPDAAVVHDRFRDDDGNWRFPRFHGRRNDVARVTAFVCELAPALGREGMDALHRYPDVCEPGDTYVSGAEESWLLARVREQRDAVSSACGLDTLSFLHGRLRSRTGWVAGIMVAHAAHLFRRRTARRGNHRGAHLIRYDALIERYAPRAAAIHDASTRSRLVEFTTIHEVLAGPCRRFFD